MLSMQKLASLVIGAITCSTDLSSAQSLSTLEQTGSEVAHEHCSRCHVVDTKNLFSGISSTPSFQLMVNGLDDWQTRFESFHTRLPHPSVVRFKGEPIDPDIPMPTVPVELEYSDIDALVAYARTLKKSN